MIDSDVPRADDSEVALVRRCSRAATEDAARCCPTASMSSAVMVASGQRLLGVEPLLTHRLGGDLAECGEIGERLAEPPLDARLRVQVVIGDQGTEVVGGQRDQHGVDELARSAGAIEGFTGVSR